MTDLLGYVPLAATAFAVPEFVPQLRKLWVTHDTAGVSWAWSACTAINSAAWFAYFALSRYGTALIANVPATLVAGALAAALTAHGLARPRPAVLVGGWAAVLGAACAVAGRAGLGTLLSAAFALQVAPSIWTAYRTPRPSGVSAGTWLLVLGELSCWLAYGLYQADPRLITLGVTGVTASAAMLTRIYRTRHWPARPGEGTGNRRPILLPPEGSP
jgi:uncharacterized protein with PQ loop repeat